MKIYLTITHKKAPLREGPVLSAVEGLCSPPPDRPDERGQRHGGQDADEDADYDGGYILHFVTSYNPNISIRAVSPPPRDGTDDCPRCLRFRSLKRWYFNGQPALSSRYSAYSACFLGTWKKASPLAMHCP